MGNKHSVCMEVNLIECRGGTRKESIAVNKKGKRMERGYLTEPMIPKEQKCKKKKKINNNHDTVTSASPICLGISGQTLNVSG